MTEQELFESFCDALKRSADRRAEAWAQLRASGIKPHDLALILSQIETFPDLHVVPGSEPILEMLRAGRFDDQIAAILGYNG